MSAGDHLHARARYGLWPDSETLAGRGEHLLHFSFPCQLETDTASPFLHPVYPSGSGRLVHPWKRRAGRDRQEHLLIQDCASPSVKDAHQLSP